MKQTFPYRDVKEADESAERELHKVVTEFHSKADLAFTEGDFRLHAIYSMAANKMVGLFHDRKELKRLNSELSRFKVQKE